MEAALSFSTLPYVFTEVESEFKSLNYVLDLVPFVSPSEMAYMKFTIYCSFHNLNCAC